MKKDLDYLTKNGVKIAYIFY